MGKVLASDVHVTRGRNEVIVLKAGTEVPTWAVKLVTNPAAYVDAPAEAATVVDTSSEGGDPYDLKKDELVALAKDRGVSAAGNKDDIVARLREQDAENEKSDDGGAESPDFFALGIEDLRRIATERGIEFTQENSDVEIATLLTEAAD